MCRASATAKERCDSKRDAALKRTSEGEKKNHSHGAFLDDVSVRFLWRCRHVGLFPTFPTHGLAASGVCTLRGHRQELNDEIRWACK